MQKLRNRTSGWKLAAGRLQGWLGMLCKENGDAIWSLESVVVERQSCEERGRGRIAINEL